MKLSTTCTRVAPAGCAVAFPGPLTPEEIARASAYYDGDSSNMSSAATPPPAPVDPADYFGPPPPPAGPLPLPADPAALASRTASIPPPAQTPAGPPTGPVPLPEPSGIVSVNQSSANAPLASTMPVRQPVSFERGGPGGDPYAPPSSAEPTPPRTSQASRAAAYYGGGDFGQGAARKLIRGTFDEDKDATQRGADALKMRSLVSSDGGAQLAREREEDAAIARLQAEEADRGFNEYQAETQRQLDAVRAKKIDPTRLFADDGAAVMAVVGGVVGGLYMGINRLSKNPFLEDLNRTIDREMAVQEKNLANEKDAVGERRALLADMRSSFKDRQLANLQARNLYYEAVKEQIAAEAARYDVPKVQADADLAIQAITREQGKLDLDAAMKKAAEARAAAAAKAAADERARKAALDEREMRVKEGTLLMHAGQERSKAGKEASANFVATGKDPATGLPTGFLARDKEVATKLTDTLAGSDELLASINEARRLRNEQGALGRTLNRGGVLPYQPEWQNKVKSIEKDLGVSWSKSKQLGAYDNGIERLTTEIVGALDSPGTASDDKLDELERRVLAARRVLLERNAGPQVYKTVHPDTGAEVVVPMGTMSTAPNNQRSVQRYDLDGKPR